jgi:hypothetical protein
MAAGAEGSRIEATSWIRSPASRVAPVSETSRQSRAVAFGSWAELAAVRPSRHAVTMLTRCTVPISSQNTISRRNSPASPNPNPSTATIPSTIRPTSGGSTRPARRRTMSGPTMLCLSTVRRPE